MQIEVGDRIRIKTYEEIVAVGEWRRSNELYSMDGIYFNPSMKSGCGQTLVVDDVIGNEIMAYTPDGGYWCWSSSWVAAVNESQYVPILF